MFSNSKRNSTFDSYHRQLTTAALALVLCLSVIAQPVTLQAADFDLGAVDITTPSGDWQELVPGQSHMYEFAYDSFKQDDGQLSLAKVDVEISDKGAIAVQIYSSKEIAVWQNGGDLKPLGVGSVLSEVTFNSKDDKRLVWQNRTQESEYFYVVVENTRNIASYYEIEIVGSGVALVKTEAMIAAEEAAAEAARIAATEVVTEEELKQELAAVQPTGPITLEAGLGPEDALAPMADQEIILDPGERRFFTFRYFRDAGKDATEVIAMLKMPVVNSVSFEVWNTDTVRKWANNEKFQPVGQGTPIGFGADYDRDPNTLVWVSRAEAGQQYFIVVKNKSSEAASFTLSVSGPKIAY